MKILEELFEGGSTEMQKRKKTAFGVICVTLALLVALLLLLLIVMIASAIGKGASKAPVGEEAVSIGETTVVTFGEAELHSGKLLILNAENPLKSSPDITLIALDRPKTNLGRPVYSVLGTSSLSLESDALKQFNLMAEQFYNYSKDDNLFISNAYDASKSSQSPLYEAGNTVALGYYTINDKQEAIRNDSIYDVPLYSWIYANAHKYGFILMTSETQTDENGKPLGSNVFRYVGVPHAMAIKTKALTFESYLDHLKNKTTADSPLAVKISGKTYAIYYLPTATEHKVPTSYGYTVSGNNIDGYVVTVDLSQKIS